MHSFKARRSKQGQHQPTGDVIAASALLQDHDLFIGARDDPRDGFTSRSTQAVIPIHSTGDGSWNVTFVAAKCETTADTVARNIKELCHAIMPKPDHDVIRRAVANGWTVQHLVETLGCWHLIGTFDALEDDRIDGSNGI